MLGRGVRGWTWAPLGGWLVAVTAADASPHHAWFVFGRGCPRLDVNLRLLTRARPGDHTAFAPRDKIVPPGRSHSLWPSPGVSIPGWGQRRSHLRLRGSEPYSLGYGRCGWTRPSEWSYNWVTACASLVRVGDHICMSCSWLWHVTRSACIAWASASEYCVIPIAWIGIAFH